MVELNINKLRLDSLPFIYTCYWCKLTFIAETEIVLRKYARFTISTDRGKFREKNWMGTYIKCDLHKMWQKGNLDLISLSWQVIYRMTRTTSSNSTMWNLCIVNVIFGHPNSINSLNFFLYQIVIYVKNNPHLWNEALLIYLSPMWTLFKNISLQHK